METPTRNSARLRQTKIVQSPSTPSTRQINRSSSKPIVPNGTDKGHPAIPQIQTVSTQNNLVLFGLVVLWYVVFFPACVMHLSCCLI